MQLTERHCDLLIREFHKPWKHICPHCSSAGGCFSCFLCLANKGEATAFLDLTRNFKPLTIPKLTSGIHAQNSGNCAHITIEKCYSTLYRHFFSLSFFLSMKSSQKKYLGSSFLRRLKYVCLSKALSL